VSDVTLDIAALDTWIGDRLPGQGQPLTAERMGAGAGMGNALFLLQRGAQQWVLRRPPAVKNHPSAANTEREWKILQALEGTSTPHPTPRLYCDDPAVLGATFLIMDVVDGFCPGPSIPDGVAADPAALFELGMAYVDGLIELSKVDWRAKGLESLGKPDGFLERQVPRWLGQLDGYRVRELPQESFLVEWLERNRPAMGSAAVMHGDYSPFNVMVGHSRPMRLAAIIDWDTGTIGDPLLDFGHLLARWVEPGEAGPLGRGAGLPGYPTRAQMTERYAAATGRDLSALAYYQALSLFKLGAILEGTYARGRKAGLPDEQNPMGATVARLFTVAAEFARGERV
jgi:aminoglycoside phosphotransferase (APT) family kinase protein